MTRSRGRLHKYRLALVATLALGGVFAQSALAQTPTELAKITDYQKARYHPLHFKPAIDTATNEQCLACHKEILTSKVREASPAGLKSANSQAWYQTLDTYTGTQDTFHARHLTSPLAKEVMNLQCNFCHQGNDPREEAPGSSAPSQPVAMASAKATGTDATTTQAIGAGQAPAFTLRKMVNPSETCLRCHGQFPYQNMTGLEQPWHMVRDGLETPEAPNGCLSCHAEMFRTVRHQVSYLNADAIEAAAKKGSSDLCYGCHGGRSWYRISYPYPRTPWPGMDPAVPDWAKDRPTASEAKYQLPKK